MIVSVENSTNYRLIWFENFLSYRFLKAAVLALALLAALGTVVLLLNRIVAFALPPLIGRVWLLILAALVPAFVLALFSKFELRTKGARFENYLGNDGKPGSRSSAAFDNMPPVAAAELSLPGKLKPDLDLGDFLSFDSAQILFDFNRQISIDISKLLAKLAGSERLQFVFYRLGIPPQAVPKTAPSGTLGTVAPEELVNESGLTAFADKHSQILPHDLLKAIYKTNAQMARFFFDNGIQEADLFNALKWEEFVHEHIEKRYRFWDLDQLLKGRGIGKRWPFGFTSNLDDVSRDLTTTLELVPHHVHVIGHKDEIESVVSTLARQGENNVVLIGDAGVGKSTIVLGFAERILDNAVPGQLSYKRVVELDVKRVLAGAHGAGEIQQRVELVLAEAVAAGNIILVIDNLPDFLDKSGAIGTADLTPILVKYMASSRFQMIATADWTGFHKHIETNPALMEVLEKVEVKEPDQGKTLLILEEILPGLETQYHCFVLMQALRKIVAMADQLIQEVPFPEKAIQLLQDFLSHYPKSKEGGVLTEADVDEFLTKRTGIPLKPAEAEEEKQKLLNLEKIMHERLIDQEEAVATIAEAMRRTRAGLSRKNRPIGNFLFLGPTGVGKTETAKTLAAIYFGSEERMIRLDMTEYQSEESVNRLIGSETSKGLSVFVNKIREQPFSLVLLDEIEKAHPKVLNLFLQVLDEGRMTDFLGRRVSFNFTIIIGTSNAGAEFIRQQILAGAEPKTLQKDLVDYVLKQGIFRPEFLNRFDAVVVYKPLGQEEIKKIAGLMLKDLAKRLKDQDYEFEYDAGVVEYLAKAGFDPVFGARAMRRALSEKIEGLIAKRILGGKYKKGGVIQLNKTDLE